MEERQIVTNNSNQQMEVTSDPAFSPASSAEHVNLELEGIGRDIHSLLSEMADLRQDFETKVQYDQDKERLIASLHGELQEYREGLHFRILKPIFTDLIIMYDDLSKLIESLVPDNTFVQKLIRHLVLFQESIEESLRRNDVDTFTCEEDVFIPGRQRVLRVIPTDNLALDRRISRRVRKGFECGSRILRPEIVEAFKYTPIVEQ